jgi:hypothetical protein
MAGGETEYMFEDLEEKIKHDDNETMTRSERRLRNIVVVVLSVVLFGGLYAALRFMES